MRLVTFQVGARPLRAGVLVDDDTRVLDLQAAHRARYGKSAAALASVLALIEGGPTALARARALVEAKRRPRQAVLRRSQVKLAAPIPYPPQMRDFLCFEKHLVQGFQSARRLRAQAQPDPEAALRDIETKGILAVRGTGYERPIYYRPSRFSVCG